MWSKLYFLLVFLLALVISPTLYSQSLEDPATNPCKEMFDNPPMRGFPKGDFIYNGADNLAAAPPKTLKLHSKFIGPYKAGCVIFEVRFKQAGDKIQLLSQREVSQQPTRISSMTASYSRAALKTLNSISNFNILAKKPTPNVSYLMAIPLWYGHPFYKGNEGKSITDVDLKKLGYPDASLVAEDGETKAFFVHTHKRNKDIFVVLKQYSQDKPLIETVETDQKTSFGHPVHRYTPAVMNEFNKLIAPHMRAQGSLIVAEVRYYAIGEDFDYEIIPSEATKVIHPRTWKPVSPPVVVALFQAQRGKNRKFNWLAGRIKDGVSRKKILTLRELRATYEEKNIPEEERRRIAKEESDKKREAYTKETMPEHLLTQKERQQKARAKRVAEAATRNPGFVYKSDAFWAQKEGFYIPQKTFEGDFLFQIRRQFPAHFLTFLTLYSERCSAEIMNPEIDFSVWADITYRNGFEVSRVSRTTQIKVDGQFWPKYLEYKKLGEAQGIGEILQMLLGHAKASQQGPSTQILSDIGKMIKRELGLITNWAAFFNQTACRSATMTQMKWNLLRAANGLKSLQKEGKVIAGAIAESDPVIVAQENMTFFEGCYDYFLYEKRDYCSCLATSAKQHLTSAERNSYAKDFNRYADEIMVVKGVPAASDPYWRLSEPKRACSR